MAVISLAAGVPSGLADRVTGEVLTGLEATLQRLAASSDGWLALLSQVFDAPAAGSQQLFDQRAEQLRQAIAAGTFSLTLELRSGQELQGGYAAYAAGEAAFGERILLNADWAATASVADLERVLLEELGHAFDQRLNGGADTAGDEGELFAARVLGTPLDAAALARISQENDGGVLQLDGQAVAVEFANVSFSNAYEMVYDLNNNGSLEGNLGETAALKEQSLHNFNITGIGQVSIADGGVGLSFSGNDVSASAVTINNTTYYGWISRPIKSNGVVRGFYFWTDQQFTTLALAQQDGNRDLDGNAADNRGFLLVVDQAWFNAEIAKTSVNATINNSKDGNLGSITYARVGSSSDRVDSALNSLPGGVPFVDTTDTDKDGIKDVDDLDDDNDGILDTVESRLETGDPISPSTIDFVYAQNAYGFQSFHEAALVYKTGDRNDPAFLFDGLSSTELRVHTDDVYEFDLKRTVVAGSSFTLEEGSGSNDALCAVLGSLGSTDVNGNTKNDIGGGVGWATIRSRFNGIVINGTTYAVNVVGDLATLFNANGKKPLVSADGKSILFYAGPSDKTEIFTSSIDITHFQIVGLAKHGGWSGLSLDAPIDPFLDTDQDGIPNRLDLDSDNDGISDLAEAVGWDASAAIMVKDANRDGTLTSDETGFSSNGVWSGFTGAQPLDSDADRIADFLDLDADNDGIPDTVELRPSTSFAANDGDVRDEDIDRDGIIARFDSNDSSGASAQFGGSFTTPVNTDASGEAANTFSQTITGFVTGANWIQGGAGWKSGKSSADYKVLTTKNPGSKLNEVNDDDGVAQIKKISGDNDSVVLDFGKVLSAGTTITLSAGGKKDKSFTIVRSADASGGGVDASASTLTFSADKAPRDFTYTVPAGGLRYLRVNAGSDDFRLDYVQWSTSQSFAAQRTPDYLDRDSDNDGLLDKNETNQTLLGVDANQDGIDDGVAASYQDPDGRVSDGSGGNPFNKLKNTDADASDVDYRSLDNGKFNVSNVVVNEGSPWAIFSISKPGASSSNVKVSLSNASGDTLAGTRIQGISDTTASGDIGSTWQFLNSSGNWVNASGGSTLTVSGSRLLLVRVKINNDLPAVYEGPEQFRVLVRDASTNALVDASGGFGTIVDDGTGDYWSVDSKGSDPIPGQDLDDDRKLVTINDLIVNEGVGTSAVPRYAVFTLSGNPGQVLTNLQLQNGTATQRVGSATIDLSGGTTDFGGTDGLQYLNASGNWVSYTSGNVSLDANGLLEVRVAIFNDNLLETKDPSNASGETFRLVATYTDYSGNAGATATGNGAIRDDGNGDPLVDSAGDVDDISIPDDDSPIYIPNLTVNEASNWAVLDVEGKAGQTYTLSVVGTTATLWNGSGSNTAPGDPSGLKDFGGSATPIQVLNASGNWVNYTGTSLTFDSTGEAAIRVRVYNDPLFEGASGETFRVTATSGGVVSTGGIVTIKDDGTGNVYDLSGNPDNSGSIVRDDDRPLTVAGKTYNEGSPYIFWTITGGPNQVVQLVSLAGDTSGAVPNSDLTGTLQYRDPAGIWRTFDASNQAQFDASGSPLLIRRAIFNDTVLEGKEDFRLTVKNTGGGNANGVASVIDDGTGFIPLLNASGSPIGLDGSGNPSTSDPSGVLNDDRRITVAGLKNVSEGSAAIFTVTLPDGNTRNTEISLTLSDGIAESGSDYGPAFTAYFYDGSGNKQTLAIDGGGNVSLPSGITTFYVNVPTTNDDPSGGKGEFEGSEDFSLTAQITGGKSASDTSIILDDGNGKVYDDKGLNPTGPGNNDRTDVAVTAGTFNENSPWAIYTVTGVPDGSGATGVFGYKLVFSDLSTDTICVSGQPTTLFSTDGGLNWQTYTPGSTIASLGAAKQVLVAVDIRAERDQEFESTGPGLESLRLSVADSRDDDTARANALILDNGSGDLVAVDQSGNPRITDQSGNPILDTTSLKDDDRPLTVTGQTYNEKSDYLFWTISGNPGQVVQLEGLTADSSGADLAADLSGNLEYLDASGSWQLFDGSSTPVLDASGTPLLVRKGVINDTTYEGLEHFRLEVKNTGGAKASGRSSLIDDGTGLIPALNGSGTPESDGQGSFTDSSGVRDDDRSITVTGKPDVSEGANAIFTVTLSANPSGTEVSLSLGKDGDSALGLDYSAITAATAYFFDGSGNKQSLTIDGTGKLSLPAGVSSFFVSVPTTVDAVYEGPESFTLTATAFGGDKSAFGSSTILDDGSGSFYTDQGVVDPSGGTPDDDRAIAVAGKPDVSEGSPAIFTVTLSGNPSGAVVSLSLGKPGDTAIAADYSVITAAAAYFLDGSGNKQTLTIDGSGNVTLPVGVTSFFVSVPTTVDAVYEGPEAFTLTATAFGGKSGSGSSTILDDGTGKFYTDQGEVDPSGGTPDDDRPTIRVSNLTITENSGTGSNPSGFAVVDVTLDKQSTSQISFTPFLTAGTASNPADFGPTLEFSLDGSGWSSVTGPISFVPGATQIKLRTAIVDDTIFDPNEQFTVNTGKITSGTVKNPSGAVGTVTIQDNEVQSLGTLSVTTKSTGNEAGTVANVFTFKRTSPDLSSSLVIPFSLSDSTAKLTTDFTTPSFSTSGTFDSSTYVGTITILPGQSTAELTVPTVNNLVVDGTRSVVARLAPVSGYTLSPAVANGFILDNDVAPSVPVVSVGNGTVVETNSPLNRTINIAISLDRIPTQDVTIKWATANASEADVLGRQGLLSSSLGIAQGNSTVGVGTDYRSAVGQLTLKAGVQSVFISIPVIGDQQVENDELFYVVITEVSVGGASVGNGGNAKGEIIIVDNDSVNNIALSYASASTSIDLRGGTGNDSLTGSTANDIITGHEGNDIIEGLDGSDVLTGSAGADVFAYSNTLHSTRKAMDHIRDLVAGSSSLGDRLRFSGAALSSRPTALFNATRTAPVVGLDGLTGAIETAFKDANLVQAGDQALQVGEAVIFSSVINSQTYSYLAVNLGAAAYEENTDFIVQVTGWNSRSFAVGALSVNDFFQ